MPDDTETEKKKKIKGKHYHITLGEDLEVKDYFPSSSATLSFTKISDIFSEKNYGPVEARELLEDDYITKADLDLYVELEYLEKLPNNIYILTDKGRKALKWNREFKKKWSEE